MITSVTVCGWEIMITCDPATSVIVAPARCACARTTSVPAALSSVATTAHDGMLRHAGRPFGSENARSETGRWMAALDRGLLGGKVGGEDVAQLRGIDREFHGGLRALPRRVAMRDLGGAEEAVLRGGRDLAERSPSSGAKAATKTSPTTFVAWLAALEITAPAYEWPTAITGPGIWLSKLAR